MSLSPHEPVKIRRQHIFVYPFHSLELPLDPVPVGLHILGVDTSRRIHEVERVVHSVVCGDCCTRL